MIKESCNLIGQNCLHPMAISDAIFSHDYLNVKHLRLHLIPSRDLDDKRILQSDWTRDTSCHTQLKVVVSDANFLDEYLHAKNLRY